MAAARHTNVRLSQAIEQYIQRITNEGQSRSSIRTSDYALQRLRKALADKGVKDPFVHNIDSQAMDDYCYGPNGIRMGHNGQGVKAISFNRYRSVLVNFFQYAVLMRWTDLNPMQAITRARPDSPVTRLLLNAGELLTLLENCNNPIQRVACAIGMNTGLRGNDVRHLTIFDASLASGVIQTEIRKTRKLDVKPITMELHRELASWLDVYAELTGLEHRGQLPSEWFLVPFYRKVNWSAKQWHLVPTQMFQNPYKLVQAPLANMGYPTKGEGFHTLRRSSARALFESLRDSGDGRDHALMIVKDFLNHASVTQTEHYLGLSQERALRDALLKDQSFLSVLAEKEQERVMGGDQLRRLHG